jgi:glucose/arabinose dehydrogenase
VAFIDRLTTAKPRERTMMRPRRLLVPRPSRDRCVRAAGRGGDPTHGDVGSDAGLLAPTAFDASKVRLSLARVTGGLSSPLFITGAGDGSGRLFVLEQSGRIRVVNSGNLIQAPFLDIRSRVQAGGERGLLGLAFHPQYRSNGRFFVNYTDTRGNHGRRRVPALLDELAACLDDGAACSCGSASRSPTTTAGMLAFGPDGYLYIGVGDGGSAGDPGNRAQSTATRLGKLLG